MNKILLVGIGLGTLVYMGYQQIQISNKAIEESRLATSYAQATLNKMINENNKTHIESEINYIVSTVDVWLMNNSTDGLYTNISAKEISPLTNIKVNDNNELISGVESIKYTISTKQDDSEHFILRAYGLRSVIGSENYITNSQTIKASKITAMSDYLELEFTNKIAIELIKTHKSKVQ